jgi:hypothetical protein
MLVMTDLNPKEPVVKSFEFDQNKTPLKNIGYGTKEQNILVEQVLSTAA